MDGPDCFDYSLQEFWDFYIGAKPFEEVVKASDKAGFNVGNDLPVSIYWKEFYDTIEGGMNFFSYIFAI